MIISNFTPPYSVYTIGHLTYLSSPGTPTKMYKCAAIYRMPTTTSSYEGGEAEGEEGEGDEVSSLTASSAAVRLQRLCQLPVEQGGDVKKLAPRVRVTICIGYGSPFV